MSHSRNPHNRAYLRHQKFRYRSKARKIAEKWNFDCDNDWIEHTTRRIEKNRKLCSCCGCRNPRHSGWGSLKSRLTRQEVRANMREREQRREFLRNIADFIERQESLNPIISNFLDEYLMDLP